MASHPPILVVIGQLDIGGTEHHLAKTLPLLVARGHVIKVFVFRGGGYFQNILENNDVEVITGSERGPRLLRIVAVVSRFYIALWKIRPSIIHFYLPEAYLVGALISLVGPKSIRVMSRRSLNNYQQKRKLFAFVEKRVHKLVDLFISNAQIVKKQLVEEGVESGKIDVIYNGVESLNLKAKQRQQTRNRWGIGEDTVVILMVANLIPYKGYDVLLNALAKLPTTLQNWHFVSVGRDSGILQDLQDLAIRLKISEKITWEGMQESISDALVASDVAVLSSHEEGFSNFILEAMSAKLPTVVSNVGGNAEAVLDGITGYVVEAASPDSLADRIHELIRRPALRKKFGDAGYERVSNHLSLSRCVEQYDEVYEKLQSRRGAC